MKRRQPDEDPAARLTRIRAHLARLFPGRSRDAGTLTRSAIATMAPDMPADVMAMMTPDPGAACADTPRCCGERAVCNDEVPSPAVGDAGEDLLSECVGCGA